MIQTNILEQIQSLYNIFMGNSYVLTISIVAIVSFLILEIANLVKNKKVTKVIFTLVYLGIIGVLVYFFQDEILKLLDYLMNNIFVCLFFPNLAIYTFVLVVVNIIFIKSTISKKDGKLLKSFNVLCFVLFNTIFYLIIDCILKNDIDIYEQLSVYTNENLLVLIELSMKLFLVWLALLVIVKISSYLSQLLSVRKANKKVKVVSTISESNLANTLEINPNNLESEFVPIKKKTITNNTPIKEVMPLENNNLKNIVMDIEKLRENQNDSKQIRKIYEQIELNQKDLSLEDYTYIITKLTEIKNNN